MIYCYLKVCQHIKVCDEIDFDNIVKGYTKISSKAKNVTLKAAPSNVRSATFDIFLGIFSFKYN
jgi:hypothetical protein